MLRPLGIIVVFVAASSLLGCGADHFEPVVDPAPNGSAPLDGAPDAEAGGVVAPKPARQGEGRLEIATRSSVVSFLGSTHLVVENAQGEVVAGAEEDTIEPGAAETSPLSLPLPAGESYTLRLTATTQDAHPTTCRATVGPVPIEAGASARVRVFAWDCGERTGYVPETAQEDCYWLADWSFVGRTRAALGEAIEVGVAATAAGLGFRWTTSAPELGSFAEPAAPQTAIRCQAAGLDLPIEVAIGDGACEQRVKHVVSCQNDQGL